MHDLPTPKYLVVGFGDPTTYYVQRNSDGAVAAADRSIMGEEELHEYTEAVTFSDAGAAGRFLDSIEAGAYTPWLQRRQQPAQPDKPFDFDAYVASLKRG